MNRKQIVSLITGLMIIVIFVLWLNYIDGEIKKLVDHLDFLNSYITALIEDKPNYDVLKKELLERAKTLDRRWTIQVFNYEDVLKFNMAAYEAYKNEGKIDKVRRLFNISEEVIPRNYLAMYVGVGKLIKFLLLTTIFIIGILLWVFKRKQPKGSV